ncbi:hypothetical protein IRT38_00470 (plasmid) [Acinetobacter sp. SK-43]|uniref:hypothetical protein n=1 Tax=Acinetobacter sp. SK-43 TaxID=2785295 RepID=UPI00188B3A6D|nr:hypothetical protein [Acinetobacter sp. SK-43]MBF4453888.1 hypothetical protein [Acinetobacter sp. SK-43]
MFSFKENGFDISIGFNNKLSINRVSDNIDISISGEKYLLSDLNPIFKSESISNISDEIYIGSFLLNNGISISGENSIELQKAYLLWESNQLNRSNITFILPKNRDDKKSGIPLFHPYFFAVVNKLARTSSGLDLVGFGKYFDQNEINFIHQYCTFHPALRQFLTLKLHLSNSNRIVVQCRIIELILESAIAHVVGYRDKIRFNNLYLSHNIPTNNDEIDFFITKFLMEYDHVLDSSCIWKEEFDFFKGVGSGGHLDILNLPF